MIFLTSDTHWNHNGIITHSDRPWKTMEEMNEGLIAAWNAVVGAKDIVWHLGDFGFKRNNTLRLDDLFERLNGEKNLIIGNHDEQNPEVLKLPWASQNFYHKLRHDGRRIILCHYAFDTWDGAHKGYFHAHGHSHGNLPPKGGRIDVGIDALGRQYNYGPIPIDDLLREFEALGPYVPVDHHIQRET